MSDRPWWRDMGKDDLHDWIGFCEPYPHLGVVGPFRVKRACGERMPRRVQCWGFRTWWGALCAHDSSMDSVYDAYLARSEVKP